MQICLRRLRDRSFDDAMPLLEACVDLSRQIASPGSWLAEGASGPLPVHRRPCQAAISLHGSLYAHFVQSALFLHRSPTFSPACSAL